jgi:pyridinium-3,5-bisthiocarboxylic acid mononucleotide nickel chelatase
MRIAYLDCFSGISGDMFLGALLDAGVRAQVFEDAVAALNLGARLEISRVKRSAISATKVDVWVGDEKDQPREEYWARKNADVHEHPHGEHDHEHRHGHPDATALEMAGHGRGLDEIREIIQGVGISETAKRTAIRIFENLGAAEAKIHDVPVAEVHFHEVGAVDAMVDIVCAAVGAETLGVDEWVCSPLNVGGGTVVCAHGTFPVPAPATVELLKDAPVYSSGIQAELVTPTGAAIVKTLATRFTAFPAMKISASGYGAGSRDFANHANVLRITVGEVQDIAKLAAEETIAILEANLDDLNPQVFGYVMDRALEEGALDAFGIPVQMKKNRPGMLLTVLARPEDADRLAKLLFTETTTLGVRVREEKRRALRRRSVTVNTRWGEIRMKIATLNGSVSNYAPEYEDCRRIAVERQVPLKSVMQEAIRQYLSGTENEQHG